MTDDDTLELAKMVFRGKLNTEILEPLLHTHATLSFQMDEMSSGFRAEQIAEAFDGAVGSARFRARAEEAGRLELLPTDAGGLEYAIGRLASIVLAAQQGGSWPRLKACAECHWALYDRTKNRSAAWCGSQCGARVRARRYRRRRREESA